MAYFKFTRGILAGEPIPVFNRGEMVRDFTYVDDIIDGVLRVMDRPAECDPAWQPAHPTPATSSAPYKIYNIGNNQPVKLMRFIGLLEECLQKKATIELLPMQPGDVPATAADISAIATATGFAPSTPVETGIARFVAWYREYYKVEPIRVDRAQNEWRRIMGSIKEGSISAGTTASLAYQSGFGKDRKSVV